MANDPGPTGPDIPTASSDAATELTTSDMPLRSWQNGIGPAYIGLFLLIVFFDRLGPYTLAVGGLAPSLAGAAVGGLLAFIMLFYAPAMWGLHTRGDLVTVAGRTFGAEGARWIPGVTLGLVQVLWFAVAIFYAADLSLKAMVMGHLTGPQSLDGPRPELPPSLGGPVFLFTTSTWLLAAALLGPVLVKIVAAILKVYAIFPALVFAGLMLWALGGLGSYSPPEGTRSGALPAFWSMVQLVFGYAATASLMGADWGASSRNAGDVRLGGLVSLGLAPLIVASVALVTIAGAQGRFAARTLEMPPTQTAPADLSSPPIDSPEGYVYHQVVLQDGIGGALGCILTMVFALALLGPACYAPTVFSQRFADAIPSLPRWGWALIGAVVAWPLAATGLAGRLATIFGLLGAVMAPLAGAIAADYVRDHGRWRGAATRNQPGRRAGRAGRLDRRLAALRRATAGNTRPGSRPTRGCSGLRHRVPGPTRAGLDQAGIGRG